MNREIRLARKHLYTGLICLPFFLTAMIGSMIAFSSLPAVELRIALVAFFGLFWGAGAVLCVWGLLTYWNGRLQVEEQQIVEQGVWLRKELRLAEVDEVRWFPFRLGGIRLRAAGKRMRLNFDHYEREDRLWLIRYFRRHLPRQVEQTDWEMFCLKVAVPIRDDHDRTVPNADEVLVKRSRYDWLMGIGLTVTTAVALFAAWLSANPAALGFPLFIIVLWILLHYRTPKQGMVERRAPRSMIWIALGMPVCLGIMILVKVFVPNGPLALLPGVLLLIATIVFVYRYEEQTKQRDRRESGASVAVWEQGET